VRPQQVRSSFWTYTATDDVYQRSRKIRASNGKHSVGPKVGISDLFRLQNRDTAFTSAGSQLTLPKSDSGNSSVGSSTRSEVSDSYRSLRKFVDGQARIPNDAAQRIGVHRIVARNRYNNGSFGHDDVLEAFPRHHKSGFLQSSDRSKVRYTRSFGNV
jgi:hypothetical protein